MTTPTFFWHDYETFGTDPQRDRVCQFAGIRTDLDFQMIGEPIMAYCKPTIDYLPHPEACLITGITPQIADKNGVCEADFTRLINAQLAEPGTCGLGYNSLRFDDEVTRNLLYRNFYDPYAREWQNQNSRWDIIDIARAARALRPEGINWPVNNEGLATFRLEELTKANNIGHTAAHDALADVYATIALARLLRDRQPKLYQFLFNNRSKTAVQDLLQLGSFTPLVHISGRFAARNNCLAIIVPLCPHPTKSNEIVVYDLAVDPGPLLECSAAEIQRRLFTATADLADGVARIPLKTVHINKCPVLAPLGVIKQADALRLELDIHQHLNHLERIKTSVFLKEKLAQVFTSEYPTTTSDPDLMIYSGGFFSNRDKVSMTKIRTATPVALARLKPDFDDARLPEMLFRYRARNFPNTLSQQETQAWLEFCRERLQTGQQTNYHTFESFAAKLQSLQAELGPEQAILLALQNYANQLQSTLFGKSDIAS